MVTVHAVLGLVLVILSIAVLIWNILRALGRVHSNKIRMAFIGLLDLQILLGIVTWILLSRGPHPPSGIFIFHPVLMVLGVVLLHVFTKESRSMRIQLAAYSIATVCFIVGMFLSVF